MSNITEEHRKRCIKVVAGYQGKPNPRTKAIPSMAERLISGVAEVQPPAVATPISSISSTPKHL